MSEEKRHLLHAAYASVVANLKQELEPVQKHVVYYSARSPTLLAGLLPPSQDH